MKQLAQEKLVSPLSQETLCRSSRSSFIITILTNQGRLSLKSDSKTAKNDLKSLTTFKSKVASVLSQLELDITLFAATGRDEYRKPRTRMWREVLEEHDIHDDGGLDLERSIFVGDAGGRAAMNGAKADHACSDRSRSPRKLLQVALTTLKKLCSQYWYTLHDARRILPQGATSAIHKTLRAKIVYTYRAVRIPRLQ